MRTTATRRGDGTLSQCQQSAAWVSACAGVAGEGGEERRDRDWMGGTSLGMPRCSPTDSTPRKVKTEYVRYCACEEWAECAAQAVIVGAFETGFHLLNGGYMPVVVAPSSTGLPTNMLRGHTDLFLPNAICLHSSISVPACARAYMALKWRYTRDDKLARLVNGRPQSR
ncbi:hypothetical protein C8R47DRAFT_602039 [Mycena vitilis]|nr:hypothetical protein C8R47DRAFT_602039 [Mycena vitilis]